MSLLEMEYQENSLIISNKVAFIFLCILITEIAIGGGGQCLISEGFSAYVFICIIVIIFHTNNDSKT